MPPPTWLNGGAGNDVLEGGGRATTLLISARARTRWCSPARPARVLIDLATSKASADGRGVDSFSGIEAIRLGDGDDVLAYGRFGSASSAGSMAATAMTRLVLTGAGNRSAH